MPLFEYHCIACDKVFEVLVTDSDEVVSCNICNSIKVKKVFSVFGVSSSDNLNGENNITTHGCKSTCCCCN